MQTFLTGFSQYWEALWLLQRPNIARYLLLSTAITLAIAFLLLGGGFYWIYDTAKDIYLMSKGNSVKILTILKEIVPLLLYFVVIWALFKNIVLIANGFIFTQLSGAVEAELTQKSLSSSGKSLAFEIVRAIRMGIWSALKETFYTLPLFLLSFIPVIGIVFIGIALLVHAYYAGIGYWDFVLERKGHDVKESIAIVNKHRYLVMGNGFGFILLMFVPFLGLILAPPLAVIAATNSYLSQEGN